VLFFVHYPKPQSLTPFGFPRSAFLAAMGRRVANATFFASHATDTTNAISFAMDLTPLVEDDALSVADFTLRHIENLRADVAGRLAKMA
jgi:hypothetical protein